MRFENMNHFLKLARSVSAAVGFLSFVLVTEYVEAQSFSDVSYTSKSMTAFGDATVVTGASSPNGIAGRFDGNGDYLTVDTNPLKVNANVATIESWVYLNSLPAFGWPIVSQNANVSGGDQVFMVTGSNNGVAVGKLRFYRAAGVGSAVDLISASTLPLNQWVHVAVSFDGVTARLFVNGNLEASAASSLAWKETDQPFYVGRNAIPVQSQNQSYADGQISSLRITAGVARYTTAFTAATSLPLLNYTQDPYASNVVLSVDSGNWQGAFVDSSPTPKTIALSNTPKVLSLPTLINGSAASFSGNVAAGYLSGTDGLVVSKSTDFALGTGDFTIEFWERTDRLQEWDTLFQIGDWWSPEAITIVQGSGFIKVGINQVDTGAIYLQNGVNQWFHVAVTREAGTLKVYLNGTVAWSGTRTQSINPNNTYGPSIGTSTSPVVGPMKGYIDRVRVTKGVARTPADMLLPKKEFGNLTLVDGKDPYSNYVSLLTLTPETVIFPRANNVVVNRNVDNSVSNIDLIFSKSIDKSSLTNATIKLMDAQLQQVLPSSIVALNSTTYRLNFSSPIVNGNYTLTVGPAIYGTNHLALDQNQNGIGGEPNDILIQGFSVSLNIEKVTLTKSSFNLDTNGVLSVSLPPADATVSKFQLYLSSTPFTNINQATLASEVSNTATSMSLSNLSTNTIYYIAVVAVSPTGLKIETVSPISFSNYVGNYSAFTYNDKGQVLTIDGPRTDVIDISKNTYDIYNNLKTFTNALNQVVTYNSYDGFGRLLSVTDANGITTLLTYNDQGLLSSSVIKHPTTSSLDSSTTYSYDPVGLLIGMTLANGTVLSYEYDGARRLTAIQNAVGDRLEYGLDAAGNTKTQIIKNSQGTIRFSVTKAFDELSRVIKVTGNNGQNDRVQYDTNDNPTVATDGLQRQTQSIYDALNRVTKTIDPAQKTTQFSYDSADRLHKVTDARGNTTTYTHDGFGHLISLSSPDTGVATFAYDAAGNRISARDSRGVQVAYQYDALNRLTAVNYPATPSENVTFSYDASAPDNFGVGHLTSVVSASSRIDYKYNYLGLISRKTSTIGGLQVSVAYSYDSGGLLRSETYPSGRVVNYTYDAVGRVQSISTQASLGSASQTVLSGITYLPFGPASSYNYGNGLSHSLTYDTDYRLTAIQVGTVLSRNYKFDAVDNITSILDGLVTSKNQTLSYDALDRLINAKGKYGTLAYTYDAVGNRLTETAGSTLATYNYETSSNRLLSIIKTGANRDFTYDPAGNRLTGTSDTLKAQTYTYNSANRLSGVAVAGAAVGTYTYNALGQRVSKVAGSIKEIYHYDEAGQLIAVTDNTGIVKREYIYNGTSLVAFNNVVTVSVAVPAITGFANQATLTGASLATTQTGYTSPTGYANFSGEGQVSWPVTINTAATYSTAVRYAMTGTNRAVDVYVDGVKKTSITFTPTTDLNTWATKSVSLALTAGAHTIALKTKGASAPNIDTLQLTTTTKVTTSTPTFYYVHNDHHNAPQVVTNQSGQVAWMMDYQPFGKVTAGQTNSIELYSRFPGQSLDSETGLYYNYFRDYDPSIGRYIESDPIGLGGGINTYAYVEGNPLSFTDSQGLFVDQTAVDTALARVAATSNATRTGWSLSPAGAAIAGLMPTPMGDGTLPPDGSNSCPNPDNNDKCSQIIADIYDAMNVLNSRIQDLLDDKLGLYDSARSAPNPSLPPNSGSWKGHIYQAEGWQSRLKTLIQKAQKNKCPIPLGAWGAATRPLPSQPRGN